MYQCKGVINRFSINLPLFYDSLIGFLTDWLRGEVVRDAYCQALREFASQFWGKKVVFHI